MPAVTVPIPLRWSDCDAYGHVNNVAIVGLLEEARVRALWDDDDPIMPPLGSGSDVWVLVADVTTRYRRIIDHRVAPIQAEVSVSRCVGASFVVDYRLLVDGEVCVEASTTMAMVEAATGRPTRLTTEQRERLLALAVDEG
ncbi:thioesterase family protein [Demequina sp. NBRC 110054]|uniref:acyl-CoA thioesterase n=1 Tax=Demequina sp. NBRC 110054 TaxID=1570343 RepID=UPI0009FE27F7|nr:thioesterase family protein [Demequina sp. NBRC 110054]